MKCCHLRSYVPIIYLEKHFLSLIHENITPQKNGATRVRLLIISPFPSDSEPTLSLAEDFLANLNRGQLFDYQELNEKALQAQNTSQEAIRKVRAEVLHCKRPRRETIGLFLYTCSW